MRRMLAVLLLIMSVVALPGAAVAAENGDGAIEGKLINGTSGGGSVADQVVTLKTFLNDAELTSATANTDAEGNFAFGELPTDPDHSYQLIITYQQAEYDGDRIVFDAGETVKPVEIVVYDATTSSEALKVMMSHTVVYVEQGSLLVSEYLLLVNDSDHTYIGARELNPGVRETLTFTLPAKATGLQAKTGFMECCIYNSEDGFIDSMAVPPGGKELAYSYRVEYQGTDYAFSRNVDYPTLNYNLLVQSPNVEIISGNLEPAGPLTIQDVQFNHFSGGDLAAGDVVSAQLSGLPGSVNRLNPGWVLLFLAVLAVGFTFFYLRSRRRPQAAPVSASDEREKLLSELAELDDDFAGGRVPEEAYRRTRAEKKAQLIRLMQRTEDTSGKQ